MKILISIANYGDSQLNYLNTIIDEFRSYKRYDITINVHSTVPVYRKDINLTLYDPSIKTKLVSVHRKEFVNSIEDYDLFLYTENDILIKEETIDTFLKYELLLDINHCLGFIRYEKLPNDENIYITPDVFFNVPKRGMDNNNININNISYFTLQNDHQGCWILSQNKLKNIISNFQFISDTSNLESGASEIYSKWIHGINGVKGGPIIKIYTKNKEDLDKCLIHHLSDKYCSPSYRMNTYQWLTSEIKTI
jgi:hypothetical protein